MDLKSMLNDSASRPQPPPRLHTSSSSISERPLEQHQSYDPPPERPTPHPTSSYAPDARAGPPGSYFPALSPQQHNSASTPSAGAQSAHSAYAQSPGPAQHFTPRRESVTQQHVYTPGHIPPPSPIGVHPSTPGSQYHHGGAPAYIQPYPPPTMNQQRPPTRDEYPQPSGRGSQPPSHQMSPPPPHHPQTPSTPLGPPTINYARPSMHSQRPPSQGYDHLRRSSVSSMGSAHSRDPSMPQMPPAEYTKGPSVQRTYSSDEERLRQERERSVESVSPKTIPRPPPQRNSSHGHYPYEQSPAGSATSHTSHPGPLAPTVEQYSNSTVSTPIQQQSLQALDARTQQVSRPSPGARPAASTTPQSTHSSIPAQPSPSSAKPPSKKRTASVISNAPPASMPPVKRIKREEKPIWAQTARKKPLRLGEKGAKSRQPRNDSSFRELKRETTPGHQQKNGHAGPPAGAHTPPARPPQPPVIMDESILPNKPRNDLIFTVCEWIWSQLGTKTPPRGSVFEVEAKLGVLWDIGLAERLRLPVLSEAVFDRAAYSAQKTKFDTSVMNEVAHKGLNDFLNHAIQWNRQSIATGAPRYPIEYTHPQEWDEYYELTPEGRSFLQPLAHWMKPGKSPKVRKTFDKKTQVMTAQIIKTRVADLDIYNPNDLFDYRISISIETPWDGPDSHLAPGGDKSSDRFKDRLSYRHRDYQIDLTQISHPGSQRHDHEVEIEINNDSLLAALDSARTQSGDRYEKCLGGFVDNIRILAGHASKAVHAARLAAQAM